MAREGRSTATQTVNYQPSPPHTAEASSSSTTSVLSPAASQALSMYLSCLENGGWCRLVLEGRKERQNFKIDCREPAPAFKTSSIPANRRRRRKRPPNPRRQERERRRREAWLKQRQSHQQLGHLIISTAATAVGNVAESAGDLPAAIAATTATAPTANAGNQNTVLSGL